MTKEEAKAKTFDILHFVADNAGLSTFEAIEKAYNMGVSEQEPILDKIRAEIKQEIIPRNSDQYDHEAMWQNMGLRMALKVIDKYKAESEEANQLSQNIIEHARRIYPKALSYKGQLTNEQFCEIEKECDIDFYKLGRQDTRFTIRYKGEESEKK